MKHHAFLCVAWLSCAGLAAAQWSSQQVARLYPEPNDLGVSDNFGASIALSGGTVVTGVPTYDPSGGLDKFGAAFVFVDGATGWTQEARLLASVPDPDARFGFAVAADGDTLAISAPYERVGSSLGAGAVYVFVRSGGSWSEQARLTASDFAALDHFGHSVALEGDTLAIGSVLDNVGSLSDCGSVYVFTRSGTTWTQQTRFNAGDAASGDQFGTSVALDGNRIAIGAARANLGATNDVGAAYVFEESGGTWSQLVKVTASDGRATDLFGSSIALDAGTLVVGAPQHDLVIFDSGAAYVFGENGGAWSQDAKLVDFGFAYADEFGTSVDIEGDRIVVGLPVSSVPSIGAGAVQLFVRTGTSWIPQFEMIGSNTNGNDLLGTSVALCGDLVATGAPFSETPPNNWPTGDAYIFRIVAPPLIESYCTGKTNSLGCVPTMSWSGTPSASNPSPFELQCSQVLNFKSGLLFYGYAPAALPFQGGTLCIAPPLRRTPTQFSYGSSLPANDCSGTFSFDMNARIQSGGDSNLVVGAGAWSQYWMRDPASSSTTGLSDAVHFEIDP